MSVEGAPAAERCQNCQAPLGGHFCSACGQAHEPHVHSVREFANEAFESITHADSRLWRTLWLLVSKPGFLTQEFFEGRRARYLPPFRLYLVLSVIFFLVAATVGKETMVVEFGPQQGQTASSIQDLRIVPRKANESAEERAARICKDVHYVGPWSKSFGQPLNASCYKVVIDDGQAFAQAMFHNVPRGLFLLLPLLALVMRAMYWRRHYVEHLLFFTHNHAFTFLLYTVLIFAIALTDSAWVIVPSIIAAVLIAPYYTWKAIKRVYPQKPWMMRTKVVALTLAYLVLVFLLAAITSLYSLVTL